MILTPTQSLWCPQLWAPPSCRPRKRSFIDRIKAAVWGSAIKGAGQQDTDGIGFEDSDGVGHDDTDTRCDPCYPCLCDTETPRAVSIAWSGGTATVTFSSPHGFSPWGVLASGCGGGPWKGVIAGATPSGYNGEWDFRWASTTTVTIAMSNPGAGSAGGSPTFARATIANNDWTSGPSIWSFPGGAHVPFYYRYTFSGITLRTCATLSATSCGSTSLGMSAGSYSSPEFTATYSRSQPIPTGIGDPNQCKMFNTYSTPSTNPGPVTVTFYSGSGCSGGSSGAGNRLSPFFGFYYDSGLNQMRLSAGLRMGNGNGVVVFQVDYGPITDPMQEFELNSDLDVSDPVDPADTCGTDTLYMGYGGSVRIVPCAA